MQGSDELWEQDYQEIIDSIPDLIFDDYDSPSSQLSPSGDINTKASCKGPKGCIGRPIRRSRSRASSKKVPTTLLKADARNFRALVQQFTGCHSASPLLRAYKGPINLNFKQCSYYPAQKQQQRQQQQMHVGYNGVHEEYPDNSFLPFGAKIEDATDVFDEDLRVGQNPRADAALTYDPFDADRFWGEDHHHHHHHHVSGSGGDYTAVLSGAMNQEFWAGNLNY